LTNNNTLTAKLKEILQHSFVYGLTASLQNILGFLLLPLLTIYYTTDSFGVYSLILLISALASAVFYLGASSALGRYYFEEDNEVYRKSIVSTTLLITVFGAVILVVVALFLSEELSILVIGTSKYKTHFLLALISTAFNFIISTQTLIIRYDKKSVLYMIISILGVVINFTVTYILLTKFKFEILAPIYGALIANFINMLVLFFYNRKLLTSNICSTHIKKILKFGIPLCLSGLTYYTLDWIDRLIIKDILSLSDVGIYSLGYRIAAVINVLYIAPFALIWAPMRMQNSKNGDFNELMTKVISYYSIIGFFIVLFLVFFGKELIMIFFKNESYNGAIKLLPILALAQLFYGYQNIVDYGIYISNKAYFYVIISIIGISINVTLNYLFIPKFGYIAAAYITLVTYIINTILIYVISNKYYYNKLEYKRLFIPLVYVAIIYAILWLNQSINEYIFIKLALFVLSIICFFIYWTNAEEKHFMKSFFKLNIKK
jgi:O-antigen/teichoic acid export membrane protein